MKRLANILIVLGLLCAVGCEVPQPQKQPADAKQQKEVEKDDNDDDGIDIGISPNGNMTIEGVEIDFGNDDF